MAALIPDTANGVWSALPIMTAENQQLQCIN